MKKKHAFHFIISEHVGTMKGCERLDPFSVITYHLSLFFLAILPGSLFWKDGNIGRRAVQWSKYRQELMSHLGAHIQSHTRPAGRLNGLSRLQHPCRVAFFFFFFQRSTPTNTFQRGKKRCQLSCLFLKHSVKDGFVHSLGWSCSKACFYGHGHSEQTCIKPICDRTEGITAN